MSTPRTLLQQCALLALLTAPPALAHDPHPDPPDPTAEDLLLGTDYPLVEVGVDLIPSVGTSGIYRGTDLRLVSIGVIGGWSGAIDGISIAGFFDIVEGPVRGLQLAGGFTIVDGPVEGLQLAPAFHVVERSVDGVQAAWGFNVVGGAVYGAQAAGGFNVSGPLQGAQIASGFNIVGGPVEGAQGSGGFNLAAGPVLGVQAAGGFNVADGSIEGVQAAGGFNVTGPVKGAQVSGGFNVADGTLEGVQVSGGFNVATAAVRGVQIAPINVATAPVQGAQIGVVNVAEDVDFALGVINVVTKGRTHVDLFTDDTASLTAVFKHGGRYFHYHYLFGVSVLNKEPILASGLGLGAHIPLAPLAFLDIDATTRRLWATDLRWDSLDLLQTLRFVAGWEVTPELAVYAGPSFNVLVSERWAPQDITIGAPVVWNDDPIQASSWPGLVVGIQLF